MRGARKPYERTLIASLAQGEEEWREITKACTDKWDVAMSSISVMWPYLSTLGAKMQPVWTPLVLTAAIDERGRTFFSPEFLLTISDDEAVGVVLHEMHHLARHHSERAGSRLKEVWNIATDMEINADLSAEGVSLPGEPVFPEPPLSKHEIAEVYYREILDMFDTDEEGLSKMLDDCLGVGQGKCGPGAGGDGADVVTDSAAQQGGPPPPAQEGEEDGGGDGGQSQDEQDGDRQGNGGQGGGEDEDEAEAEAKGAAEPGGSPGGSETPSAGKPNLDEIAREAGVGGVDPWEIEVAAVQAARDLMSQSSGIGKEHGWAKAVLSINDKGKVDWRRELRDAIRRSGTWRGGQDDYSWRRLSRRKTPAVTGGLLMPAMVSPAARVAVVIDTSASMSERDIAAAAAEAVEVASSVGETTFIACDVEAAPARLLNSRTMELTGGGGTDMSVGIAAAMEEFPRPDVVLVLTDGWTPWPSQEPASPVVVGLIGEHASAFAPPWARTVNIEAELARGR